MTNSDEQQPLAEAAARRIPARPTRSDRRARRCSARIVTTQRARSRRSSSRGTRSGWQAVEQARGASRRRSRAGRMPSRPVQRRVSPSLFSARADALQLDAGVLAAAAAGSRRSTQQVDDDGVAPAAASRETPRRAPAGACLASAAAVARGACTRARRRSRRSRSMPESSAADRRVPTARRSPAIDGTADRGARRRPPARAHARSTGTTAIDMSGILARRRSPAGAR